eukprot:2349781-Heterocapsa_arctica.AAC.1
MLALDGFDRPGKRPPGKRFVPALRRNFSKKPLLKILSRAGSLSADGTKATSRLPVRCFTRFSTSGGSGKLVTHARVRWCQPKEAASMTTL